jgi:hypothetical protein
MGNGRFELRYGTAKSASAMERRQSPRALQQRRHISQKSKDKNV